MSATRRRRAGARARRVVMRGLQDTNRQNRPNQTNNEDFIDVEQFVEAPSCIDLTEAEDEEVVDLTSPTSDRSPVVILGSTTGHKASRHNSPHTNKEKPPKRLLSESPTRRSQRRSRGRGGSRTILSDSESEDEDVLVLPPFNVAGTPLANRPGGSDQTTGGSTDAVNSPEARPIQCPVCLDSMREIRQNGRRLNSTICGHIFCSQCIQNAVKSLRQCPTCRKRLTLRQIHPIYL